MSDEHRETEDRLRDALSAFTEQVEPTGDAWARIRAEVDRSTRRRRVRLWGSVAVAGAAAAIVGAVALTALRGPEETGPDVANPETGTDPTPGFVALTGDGELRRYGPDGSDRGLVADTGFSVGANVAAPTFDVTPDGEAVYFSRPATDPSCPRSDQLGSEIARVPIDRGEPEVVAAVGETPAVSPDGSKLAYVTREANQDPCDPLATTRLVVMEIDSGESTELASTDLPEEPGRPESSSYTFRTAGVLEWSPDGASLLTNVGCAGGSECEAFLTTLVFPDTGEVRYLRQWGEGFGGPAATFSGSGEELAVFLDTSDAGADTQIGLADPDRSFDPETGEGAVTVPRYIVVPDATRIEALSASSSDDAPGILAVVEEAGSGGVAYAYTGGQEGAPVLLTSGVIDAQWLPGTTFADVDGAAPTVTETSLAP